MRKQRKTTTSAANKTISNVGRRFVMFVKVYDEDGYLDEKNSGWLSLDPKTELIFSYKKAFVFTEKEEGHGSYSDWKKFFEEEYTNWKISKAKYLD